MAMEIVGCAIKCTTSLGETVEGTIYIYCNACKTKLHSCARRASFSAVRSLA